MLKPVAGKRAIYNRPTITYNSAVFFRHCVPDRIHASTLGLGYGLRMVLCCCGRLELNVRSGESMPFSLHRKRLRWRDPKKPLLVIPLYIFFGKRYIPHLSKSRCGEIVKTNTWKRGACRPSSSSRPPVPPEGSIRLANAILYRAARSSSTWG